MTKKYLTKLAAVLCCAMTMAVLTACTSDNEDNLAPGDSPTDQAEYAILFYGFGGNNLDTGILGNMMDFYKAKSESYAYEQLAFDKATGWSRWLKLNKQLPAYNSIVEMRYPLE